MASGILGQSAPSATTLTTVYTVPANTLSVVNVSITNRGSSSATVRLALAAASTPVNSEYIEYDAVVLPNGVLERTGIALNETKRVVVYSSTADTSVSVFGLEQSTL